MSYTQEIAHLISSSYQNGPDQVQVTALIQAHQQSQVPFFQALIDILNSPLEFFGQSIKSGTAVALKNCVNELIKDNELIGANTTHYTFAIL